MVLKVWLSWRSSTELRGNSMQILNSPLLVEESEQQYVASSRPVRILSRADHVRMEHRGGESSVAIAVT
jgi:hypothetical protein